MKIYQIKKIRYGDAFKIREQDEKIYIRGFYVHKENKYSCKPRESRAKEELFAGTKEVFKVEIPQ